MSCDFGRETRIGILERAHITNYNANQGDQLDLLNGMADILGWLIVGSNTELVLARDRDLMVLAGGDDLRNRRSDHRLAPTSHGIFGCGQRWPWLLHPSSGGVGKPQGNGLLLSAAPLYVTGHAR